MSSNGVVNCNYNYVYSQGRKGTRIQLVNLITKTINIFRTLDFHGSPWARNYMYSWWFTLLSWIILVLDLVNTSWDRRPHWTTYLAWSQFRIYIVQNTHQNYWTASWGQGQTSAVLPWFCRPFSCFYPTSSYFKEGYLNTWLFFIWK